MIENGDKRGIFLFKQDHKFYLFQVQKKKKEKFIEEIDEFYD